MKRSRGEGGKRVRACRQTFGTVVPLHPLCIRSWCKLLLATTLTHPFPPPSSRFFSSFSPNREPAHRLLYMSVTFLFIPFTTSFDYALFKHKILMIIRAENSLLMMIRAENSLLMMMMMMMMMITVYSQIHRKVKRR